MNAQTFRPLRWNEAVLEHGEGLRAFWKHHLAEKQRWKLPAMSR